MSSFRTERVEYSELFKKWRENYFNESQQNFAVRIGKSLSFVQSVEYKKRTPYPRSIAEIAKKLEMSQNEFLLGPEFYNKYMQSLKNDYGVTDEILNEEDNFNKIKEMYFKKIIENTQAADQMNFQDPRDINFQKSMAILEQIAMWHFMCLPESKRKEIIHDYMHFVYRLDQ